MTTWILVADESRARLFKAQAKDGQLEEIADIAHPEGRMHEGEMTRDRLPRTQESVGGARHAIEPHTSVEDKVSLEFARELAERLEHGRVDHAYDELVLVAAPRFLGVLRATIGHEVSKLVVKSIDKGITRSTPEQIRSVVDAEP